MQSTARFLWQRLEPIHGMIYFVPEADERYAALGLDPGMMGYFGSRSAAMGAVTADVVVATFYNFEPGGVHAVVPEVWRRTTPDALWSARLDAVDAAMRRLLGELVGSADIARAAELLRRAVDGCRPEGRPLFAGHLAQAWPDDPHLALWFGVTLLREYRGDGHVACLTHAAVSGVEALVIHGATGAVRPKVLQATRAWSDDAWQTAAHGLMARGWLSADGALTLLGRSTREEIEQRTDELAAAPWSLLAEDDAIWLAALGKELSGRIVAAGTFPGR